MKKLTLLLFSLIVSIHSFAFVDYGVLYYDVNSDSGFKYSDYFDPHKKPPSAWHFHYCNDNSLFKKIIEGCYYWYFKSSKFEVKDDAKDHDYACFIDRYEPSGAYYYVRNELCFFET